MNRWLFGLALGLSLVSLLPDTARAQFSQAGSQVLTDQPTGARDLKDLEKPSTDSSLLLNDNTSLTLESVLQQRKVQLEKPVFVRSPIEKVDGRSYSLVTASHLRDGELQQTQIVRLFQPEAGVNDDLFTNQSSQYIWGLSDNVEMTVDLQGANGSVPGFQGDYLVERRVGVNNGNIFQDVTVQGKFRLGEILGGKTSAVASITTSRPQFTFRGVAGSNLPTVERRQDGLVFTPALELPLTFTAYDERYAFTVSPRLVYFPGDNAIYTPINPGVNQSFGLTFGLGIGGTFKISNRFHIRGDATAILAGSNTVDRSSGLPTKVIPYNAGVRYLVNPRLALDVFVSNTYGNTGGPALVAVDNNTGVGVGLTFMQDRLFYVFDLPVNRQFADTFDTQVPAEIRAVYVPASFDLLDGSTIGSGRNQISFIASTGTFSFAYRAGTLNDFETGVFGNFAPAGPDESDGGLHTKLRFLHQPSGDPFTLSGVFTLGRTSSRACNFIDGTRDGLERALDGLPTACPGVPGVIPAGDRGPIPPNLIGLVTENIGELFVFTLSFPAQFTLKEGHSFWINPKLAYIQRSDERSPLIGASLGGSIRLWPGFDLIAQVTPMVRGENAFVGNSLAQLLPWQAGVRFLPGLAALSVDLFATNALGLSPYQSLRVRADNQVSVALGFQLPF
ncbi:hypothetical protein [Gloeobacter violaceus]|uniref:hypothetical protein n=1 Tax=Gloeobacter violaceus TaxID=33072 RepID=UPI0013E8B982|nr:hypothetical protein [Gloeobacter violaceus]